MSNDVIKLVPQELCLEEDLRDIEFHIESAAPESFAKFHLLSLLYPILESDIVDKKCKTRVIKILLKHSDTIKVMLRYGSKEISEILYEAEAKVRNIG